MHCFNQLRPCHVTLTVTIQLIRLPFSFLFPSFDDDLALMIILHLPPLTQLSSPYANLLSLTHFPILVISDLTYDSLIIYLWQIYLIHLEPLTLTPRSCSLNYLPLSMPLYKGPTLRLVFLKLVVTIRFNRTTIFFSFPFP